LRPFP
jgi:hypothetical protein